VRRFSGAILYTCSPLTLARSFAALLDGNDARFGLDRTNPAFKETAATKAILKEQGKRRDKKRKGGDGGVRNVVAKVGEEGGGLGGGAGMLAGLVNSFKANAANKSK
jgi:hypothetical protein